MERVFASLSVWYVGLIFSTVQNVSILEGGGSIHKRSEITMPYCSDRLVWKGLLLVGCVVMQTRQSWMMYAQCALMISLTKEKSYRSRRSHWHVLLLFRQGEKLKGTTNIDWTQCKQCVRARNLSSAYPLGFTCRRWTAEFFNKC